MRFPFILRSVHDAVITHHKERESNLFSEVSRLSAELSSEREISRSLVDNALLAVGMRPIYHPDWKQPTLTAGSQSADSGDDLIQDRIAQRKELERKTAAAALNAEVQRFKDERARLAEERRKEIENGQTAVQ